MILIIGSVVSLFIQYLKNKLKLGEYATLGVLLALALVSAVVYTVLVKNGYWETVVGILATAGVFYTFIIARFEKGSALSKAMGNG